MNKLIITSLISLFYFISLANSDDLNLNELKTKSFKDVISTVDRWSTASFETSFHQIIFGTDSYCECIKLMSDISNVKCGKYSIRDNSIYLNNNKKGKADFIYKGVKKIFDENMGYMDEIVIMRGRDVYMGSGVSTLKEKDVELVEMKNNKKQPQEQEQESDEDIIPME